jgi:hypothetical protein
VPVAGGFPDLGKEVPMLSKPLLRPILDDDALTRGLGDPEARVLVEWLVEQAEQMARNISSEVEVGKKVERLCRRARGIVHFVRLWCYEDAPGAAVQLVGAERFNWPLPAAPVDPCELMQSILSWEARQFAL